ncbi:ankyrin repeat domain-containing protein 34B-like [Mastacembelus armatus]|uniref:ankyrin repeat domain-containing protein 34B-like n=1 Tax=Mastacembelus armatus TaxID=205130 RepID=UPI000E45E907|nr:ankyrin repeat domain-containing protein 34B-like [Mastacembelus armatus]
MGDPLSDCSPLINAATSGKLRLVRLLVEGGAQVNGRNSRGETALLAACKALRGEPSGPDTVKLLTYLLQNKADPNAQDRAGRTALMYACLERAGPQVASTLLSAGADPSMEDFSGASALVYAINAQHQPTIKVLMDALHARGHDIIIIATEMGVNGGPVTRRYLNVPPSPDTSPVSCMSPSDIVLKTGSPNSPEGENIFNFRGTSHRGSSSSSRHDSSELSPLSQCGTPLPRQRQLSEPWLAIHNLTCLNTAYERGMRQRSLQEEGNREELRREGGRKENEEGEDENEDSHAHQSKMDERREELVQKRENRHEQWSYHDCHDNFFPRISQSVLSLTEVCSSQAASSRLVPKSCETSDKTIQKSIIDKLPVSPSPHTQLRRNTMPSVMVIPPLLHLPPLVNRSGSHLQVPTQVSPSKSRSMVFLPHPPNSSPPSSSSSRTSARPALLPSLPPASSVTSLVGPPDTCCGERSRRSARRHSVEDKWFRGGEQMNHLEL